MMNNFRFIDPRNRELRIVDADCIADRFPCSKEKLLENIPHIDLTTMWMTFFNTIREISSSFGLLSKWRDILSSVAFGILAMSP